MAYSLYTPLTPQAVAAFAAAAENGTPPPVIENKSITRLFVGATGSFKLIDKTFGSSFKGKTGLFGAGVKKNNVLCVAALPVALSADAGGNEFLLGMSDGSLGTIAKGGGRLATFTPLLVTEDGKSAGAVTALWVVKIKDGATPEEVTVSLLLSFFLLSFGVSACALK